MGRNRQTGAQVVEFALVLPFLILVLFVVLDFGILVYDKAIITNASREAVRKGIELSGATWTPANIQQVACTYAKSALISVGTAALTNDCSKYTNPTINVYSGSNANCPSPIGTATPGFGDPVAVTISYNVTGFSLGTWWSLGTGANSVGSAINLASCTQMNHE